MIKFFRKIRQQLLSDPPERTPEQIQANTSLGRTGNKFSPPERRSRASKYLLYAIGEIVLVVIGILIALQINNVNENRKERVREVNYLKNLKADLVSEIKNNEYFATFHFEKATACASLLNSEAPNSIEEVQNYTDTYEHVFVWQEFVPNNNTFNELLSSGNLSLIKNDSIKNKLLELEKLYANIANGEHHMRREYEAYLYDPHVNNVTALGFFDLSKPSYGLPNRLTVKDIPIDLQQKLIDDAKWQHNNEVFKNGMRLAMMNNGFLAGMHKNLSLYIIELIEHIDTEIKK